MKVGGVHLAGLDELSVERTELQTADQVGDLIERRVNRRPPDFGLRIRTFVTDAIDEKIDGLLRGPAPEVDSSRRTRSAPRDVAAKTACRSCPDCCGETPHPIAGAPNKAPNLRPRKASASTGRGAR